MIHHNYSRVLLSGHKIKSNLQELTAENRIILFQKATLHQQLEASYWLFREFNENYLEMGKKTIKEVYNCINHHFTGGNSMYLYIGQNERVWGIIGLDYNNHEPIICNLLVIPQVRGLGLAKKLLRFAESEILESKFNQVKLWCSKSLLDFYKSLDYNVEQTLELPSKIRVEIPNENGEKSYLHFNEKTINEYLDDTRYPERRGYPIDFITPDKKYILTKTLKETH